MRFLSAACIATHAIFHYLPVHRLRHLAARHFVEHRLEAARGRPQLVRSVCGGNFSVTDPVIPTSCAETARVAVPGQFRAQTGARVLAPTLI